MLDTANVYEHFNFKKSNVMNCFICVVNCNFEIVLYISNQFNVFIMTKQDIEHILQNKHHELFEWLNKQSDDSWIQGPTNKWTVGQHVLHLLNALQLLNKVLGYPKFLLKYKFGKSNRPSRSYDAIVNRYQEKLALNQEKAQAFNERLRIPTSSERKKILLQLQLQNQKLQGRVHHWKNKELDRVLVPHPLMGRMTVREIIMWTAHHTDHHTSLLKVLYS